MSGSGFYSGVWEWFLLWCLRVVSTLVSGSGFYSGVFCLTLTEDSQCCGGRHRAQVVTGNTAVCSRVLALSALDLQPAGELEPLGTAPRLGRGQRERIRVLITWPESSWNILSRFHTEILNPARGCETIQNLNYTLKIKYNIFSEKCRSYVKPSYSWAGAPLHRSTGAIWLRFIF